MTPEKKVHNNNQIGGRSSSASGKRSKKASWRKIVHAEVDNVASQDVTETIVKRSVSKKLFSYESGASQRCRSTAPSEADTVATGSSYFRVDHHGMSKLGRKLRRDVVQAEKGVAQLSRFSVQQLGKTEAALPRREATLRQQKLKRERITEVFDVWDTAVSSTRLPPSMKKRAKVLEKPSPVPAVCLPLSGQSLNPTPEAYTSVVMAAVAVENKAEEKRQEIERNFQPLTNELLDYLPQDLVSPLTFTERQRLLGHIRNSQPASNSSDASAEEDVIEKAKAFIAEMREEIEVPDGLGGTSQSTTPVTEPDAMASVPLSKKPSEKKTRTARNRFERHCRLLKEAADQRALRQFRHSVELIKQYLSEIKDAEEKQLAKAAYQRALKEAKLAAQARGINVQFKCGRYRFEEAPIDVLLPSSLQASSGCLRSAKLGEVSGAAAKDRLMSIYRRRLVELPAPVTEQQLTRLERRCHWKNRSRKFSVKF